MKRKYSVFLINVGSCSDRYCSAYGQPYSITEMFDRAASIPLVKGVDLVATPDLLGNVDEVKAGMERTGLKIVSIAVDHFTQAKWKQGSFSSTEPDIRSQAISATTQAMDLAAELDCDLITIWPGQDGYDYIFQTDYVQQRNWFEEGVKKACSHRKDIRVSLEYKIKEPRTHCFINTVGTTLLTVQSINEPNLGIAFDYGHALMAYENPAESIALMHKFGNKLMHIHINDNYRYWDDDMIVGSVHTLEYLEFFFWLRKTGYDGWITIDQFPYREDGREAVSESAEWMDALESVLDRADPEEIAATIKAKDAVKSSKMMRKLLFGV